MTKINEVLNQLTAVIEDIAVFEYKQEAGLLEYEDNKEELELSYDMNVKRLEKLKTLISFPLDEKDNYETCDGCNELFDKDYGYYVVGHYEESCCCSQKCACKVLTESGEINEDTNKPYTIKTLDKAYEEELYYYTTDLYEFIPFEKEEDEDEEKAAV